MLFEITKYLDVISPLLLLMFFLVKEKTSSWGDYIFLYITAQTIINGIAIIYDKVLLRENLFLYHVNCLTSVLILSGFFSSILEHKNSKNPYPLSILHFACSLWLMSPGGKVYTSSTATPSAWQV
jgi:hypothetical protein